MESGREEKPIMASTRAEEKMDVKPLLEGEGRRK